MNLSIISPGKNLNKAYLKQSLKREQIELFKANLARMFERICTDEHEEHLKNIVSDFLKDTWYKQTNEINTSGRTVAGKSRPCLSNFCFTPLAAAVIFGEPLVLA